MTRNSLPLGYSLKQKLKNGDLVRWKVWKIEDKKLKTIIYYGTILDINVERRGQRDVYVASVLSSVDGELIQVNLLRLEKEETN